MGERSAVVPALAMVGPFAGFVAAIVLLWQRLVGPLDLALLVVLYVVCGLGVTVGFHRLLTHRSFATHRWVEYALAVLGSMAVFGPPIDWVADHRRHHAHTDRDGDPHSPHGGGRGVLGGLWHAHAGWLFRSKGRADRVRYAPDLMDDPGMVLINRAFPLIAAASLALPFGVGLAATNTLAGGLVALTWGGLARIFLFHHAILGVNAIGHAYGRRRFETDDRSTNVFWLAPVSLGESWHHNHHAFPRSAVHGMRWFELDLSGLAIRALARAGLAWDVVVIPSDRQRQRLATPA